MTQRSDIPFNVTLLSLTPKKLEGLKPVRVLDVFDGSSTNFHEDGLFSVSTFGKVGDEKRSLRFSFIDIKIPIFHPIIYRTLLSLKRLYGDIMAGTEYAIWNKETSDFERSDPVNGSTGFSFFLSHWREIQFTNTDSEARDQGIALIRKYGDTALTSKIVVIPAGIRDVEIGDDNRIQEDEINTIYRKILSMANTIPEAAVRNNPEIIDSTRFKLQQVFNSLYDNLESRISGKKKLLMGKWASRRIMNGTRNVITAMDTSVPMLGGPGTVKFNNTQAGLYQSMKAVLPMSLYHLRNGFLTRVFSSISAPARLVNKKTLKREDVMLKPMYFDRWTTNEGLEKVITSFAEEAVRHKAIEIEGRYLGLIYKGPDMTFKIIQDIDEVPESRNRGDVSPLTFCELLYLSVYMDINRYPALVTRYPIAGMGSIYPSKLLVKTTTKWEVRRELNDSWEPMDDSHVAHDFPVRNQPFFNSTAVHTSHLAGLTADHDGDTVSLNVVYSDEAIKEVDDFLKKKRAYVGVNGKFLNSVDIATTALVLHNLTG